MTQEAKELFQHFMGLALVRALHWAVLISINFSSLPTVGIRVWDLPEGQGAWIYSLCRRRM